MTPTTIITAVHWEDTDLVVMSRVQNLEGQNITQASLSSLVCNVYNRSTRVLINSTALVIGSTVFNTLQVDDRWEEDATGYNFRHTVSGDYFPEGDTSYRVEVVGTPLSGSTFLLAAVDVDSLNRFSG